MRQAWRMILVLFQLLATVFYGILGHPQCINSHPPFDTIQLEFCGDYSMFGCCDQERDADIKQLYESLVDNVNSTYCQVILKEILCQECNPYSAHLYTTEANGIQSPLPGLCMEYCTTFHRECASIVPLVTDDEEIQNLAARSTEEFCEKVSLDSEYCYPLIRDDENLQRWIEESRTGTGRYGEGCVCLDEFANGLRNPAFVVHANDSTHRLFIAEQLGFIYVYLPNKTKIDEPFLDITSEVILSGSLRDSRGLLGLAFHPNHEENHKLYVFYNILSSNQKIRISEFQTVVNNINKVNISTERILLEVDKELNGHNGGQLLFGTDGYLYASLGDGGGAGDPFGTHGNGQNLSTLLGSVIRIDIDHQENGKPYAIPADNPFVNEDPNVKRHEIYAYGARNMWRCTVDRGDPMTGEGKGRIFCGDVGQERYEEVDMLVKGGNYGWRGREGYECYDDNLCSALENEVLPINVYDHTIGKAVIGGYVYRGCQSPKLQGKYIFGDYMNGRMFELTEENNQWTRRDICFGSNTICTTGLVNTYPTKILTFGEDESGEIYVAATSYPKRTNPGGKVFKIVEPSESGNCEVDRVPFTIQGSTTDFVPSQPVQCFVYPEITNDPTSPSSQLLIAWNCDDANAEFQVTYQLIKRDQCDEGDGSQEAPFNRMIVSWNTWNRRYLGGGNYGHSGTLSNMIPYSTYRVFVQSRTPNPDEGYWLGPVGDAVHTTTCEIAPSSLPRNVENSDRTNTSLTFTWLQHSCGERKGLNSYEYILRNSTGDIIYSGTTLELFATVDNLLACSSYSFMVKAFNTGGSGNYSELVMGFTEPGVPGHVQSLATDDISSNTWTLSWEAQVDVPCPTNDYCVEYALFNRDQCDEIGSPEFISYGCVIDTHVTISGLQPYSTYEVHVNPRNDIGHGPRVSIIANTKESAPLAPPSNVQISATTNASLTFDWQQVPCGHRGGIISYEYALKDEEEHLINSGTTSYLFSSIYDLAPCTMYHLEVKSVNNAGDGNVSEPSYGVTAMIAPGPVQSLITSNISSSTWTLSWDSDKSNPCTPDGYWIEYTLVTRDQCEEMTKPERTSYGYVTDTLVTISGLHPYSTYEVFVFSRNAVGDGQEQALTGETKESAPSAPPSSVQSSAATSTSLTFHWLQVPCRQRGGANLYEYILKDDVGQTIASETTTNLNSTITDLVPCTTYRFMVKARNSAGEGMFSEPVEIITSMVAPGEVQSLKTDYISSNSWTVSWDSQSATPCPTDGYTILYALANEDQCEEFSDADRYFYGYVTDQSVSFTGLQPHSTYEVFVYPRNDLGSGPESTYTDQTQESKPTGTPQSVAATDIGQKSLSFSWTKPECGDRNGNIVLYSYVLTDHYRNTDTAGSIDVTAIRFQDLTPYVNYSFRVAAVNSAGQGRFSEAIVNQTREDIPLAPTDVLLANADKVSIRFQWAPPVPSHGAIIGYEVQYWKSSDGIGTAEADTTIETEYGLSGLQADDQYTFAVRAETSVGKGDWSNTITAIAKEGNPGPPDELIATAMGDTSVFLQWKQPRNPNGVIIDYTINYQALEKLYESNFAPDGDYTSATVEVDDELLTYEIPMTDLEPSTMYEFKVSGRTEVGRGKDATVEVPTRAFKGLKQPKLPKMRRSGTSVAVKFNDLPKYVSHVYIAVEKVNSSKIKRRQGSSSTDDSVLVANLTRNDIEDGIFIIGDGKTYGGYQNHILIDGQMYAVRIAHASCTPEECAIAWSQPSTTSGSADTRTATLGSSGILGAIIATIVVVGIIVILAIVILCFRFKFISLRSRCDANEQKRKIIVKQNQSDNDETGL